MQAVALLAVASHVAELGAAVLLVVAAAEVALDHRPHRRRDGATHRLHHLDRERRRPAALDVAGDLQEIGRQGLEQVGTVGTDLLLVGRQLRRGQGRAARSEGLQGAAAEDPAPFHQAAQIADRACVPPLPLADHAPEVGQDALHRLALVTAGDAADVGRDLEAAPAHPVAAGRVEGADRGGAHQIALGEVVDHHQAVGGAAGGDVLPVVCIPASDDDAVGEVALDLPLGGDRKAAQVLPRSDVVGLHGRRPHALAHKGHPVVGVLEQAPEALPLQALELLAGSPLETHHLLEELPETAVRGRQQPG